MTLEAEHDAIVRKVLKVLADDPTLMRFRSMVVVGTPADGRADLTGTAGGTVEFSAVHEAGLTLADGDSVWVVTVAGQPRIFGKAP